MVQEPSRIHSGKPPAALVVSDPTPTPKDRRPVLHVMLVPSLLAKERSHAPVAQSERTRPVLDSLAAVTVFAESTCPPSDKRTVLIVLKVVLETKLVLRSAMTVPPVPITRTLDVLAASTVLQDTFPSKDKLSVVSVLMEQSPPSMDPRSVSLVKSTHPPISSVPLVRVTRTTTSPTTSSLMTCFSAVDVPMVPTVKMKELSSRLWRPSLDGGVLTRKIPTSFVVLCVLTVPAVEVLSTPLLVNTLAPSVLTTVVMCSVLSVSPDTMPPLEVPVPSVPLVDHRGCSSFSLVFSSSL